MKDTLKTRLLWPATGRIPQRPPLEADISTEVCVVGAGIAGLSAAYLLAGAGRGVIVVDRSQIGGGETQRTTAHLSCVPDSGVQTIERVHGLERLRLAVQSHARAIDEIERIVALERIDCAFERLDGYLFAPPGSPASMMGQELDASVRAGIEGVEKVSRAPLPDFDTGPAIRCRRQAQFHPLRYLSGLAEAFERLGGRIFCGSRVDEIKGGAQARIRLRNGRLITASAAVVATNTPFNDRVVLHTKQASYRTYAIAAPVPAGSVPRGLYWDMDHPFHYVRLHAAEDGTELLIIGGEDHKTGQADDQARRFARLEEWTRERFPSAGKTAMRWSGQIIETADGLAFIGRNPGDADNVFVATGDCGQGMTHGTIAGMLLTELVAGRSHPWEALYDPGRAHARSFRRWARENLNAAAQYAGHLSRGEVRSVSDIVPGSGAVMRRGLAKVAVYRAPDGSVREFSANCPHLGGVVCWNPAEKTWDCPAHGSRFDTEGRVLNGPASRDLSPAKAGASAA